MVHPPPTRSVPERVESHSGGSFGLDQNPIKKARDRRSQIPFRVRFRAVHPRSKILRHVERGRRHRNAGPHRIVLVRAHTK
jgi:hypothetical protein